MANPRKFSEKIALHTHRQAEETARFEQIMREVSDATARVTAPDRNSSSSTSLSSPSSTSVSSSSSSTTTTTSSNATNKTTPISTSLSTSQLSSPTTLATLVTTPSTKNTLRINNQLLGAFRGGSLPNVAAGVLPTVKSAKQQTNMAKDDPPSPNTNYRTGSRARSQGGPIRRPHDRRLDTSPYSSSMFLSPPHDTSWRRTHSDSALHQTAMQDINSNNDNSNNRWMTPSINGPERGNDGRPKSSCEMPRVPVLPGINIYPSAHVPGTIQIPISSSTNTGSLPDLTNVDFSSPIHVPLDQEPEQGGSSPYSSSPVNTSPSTLSPTSIPQGLRQPPTRFQLPPVTHAHSNHLSVPVNSRYPPHHNNSRKNVQIENKNMSGLIDGADFTQLSGMSPIYQTQQPPPPSPQQPPTSPSPTLQQTSVSGYRSPRPSPQSSPSLGGRHSAPCSPGAPSPLPNDYNIFNQHQATQFQQHFEQLSMDWAQLVASLMESGCTWSAQLQLDTPVSNVSYGDQSTNQMIQTHPQTLPEVSVGNIELTSDPGYYSTSPSQLVYPTAPPSLHTTPNTPTSIPDIILTDFSSASEDTTRQDFSKHLEAELFSEETLRESLEPLDFDELQMLSDSSMTLISDSVEDGFRLHRS